MAATASDSAVEGHDGGDHLVDLLGGLLLVGFDVSCRGGAHVDVVNNSSQDWVPAMGTLAF